MNRILLLAISIFTLLGCVEKEEIDYCKNLDKVDREMLNIIGSIENKYNTEKEFLRRFNDAQVFWIQYKDRHVGALYPLKKDLYTNTYGDKYNQCKCKEWARLTQMRIDEINVWLSGPAIYDECPTSISQ